MSSWRKPTLKEYALVSIIFIIVVAILIPTCNFGHSKKVNESMAVSNIINLLSNQLVRYKESGQFYSNEELQSTQNYSEWNKTGYDVVYESDKKSFRLWLSPKNYGKEVNLSYYIDSNDGDVHGANHQGAKATINDPIVQKISDKSKEILKKTGNKNRISEIHQQPT